MRIVCGNDLLKAGMVTGLNLADTIQEARTFDPNRSTRVQVLQQASLINRLVALGLNITEVGMLLTKQDAGSLEKLKRFECLSSCINIPLQLMRGISRLDFTLPGVTTFFDQAIVTPLSQAVQTHAEQNSYSLQALMDRHGQIAGIAQQHSEFQKMADMALQMRLLTKVVSTSVSSMQLHQRYALLAERYALAVREEIEDNHETGEFNLLTLGFIPDVLHEAFQKYICPISQCPILDPVQDPTAQGENPVYYERAYIINALTIRPISPWTREPLAIDQLIECPELKAAIHMRLKQFQEGLTQYLSEQAAQVAELD